MPKDSSAKYYQNKKENKTIKNVHERCQSLSKEEKEKKMHQYCHEWYKNL